MRKIAFIIGIWMCLLPLQAQDMKTLFIAMPDSLAPLLTKVNREDFVDFMESRMKAEVKNRMGSSSEMKQLTEDYLLVQTTERSRLEMKLLPLNDSVRVVCVVRTVCGPACDSSVRFYDAQWQELAAGDFVCLPDADAFYDASTFDEDYAAARGKADMDLIEASLSADDARITFTYATPDYLSEEDRDRLSAYLKPDPLVYAWDEGMFRCP